MYMCSGILSTTSLRIFSLQHIFLTFKQKKGSGGPWEPSEKAKGLRGHEGHACQEAAGWEKGKVKLCADKYSRMDGDIG